MTTSSHRQESTARFKNLSRLPWRQLIIGAAAIGGISMFFKRRKQGALPKADSNSGDRFAMEEAKDYSENYTSL